jgi:hypothetical protein
MISPEAVSKLSCHAPTTGAGVRKRRGLYAKAARPSTVDLSPLDFGLIDKRHPIFGEPTVVSVGEKPTGESS